MAEPSTLVTLAAVKQHLGISHSAQDTVLTIMIQGAEEYLARELGTPFAATAYTEYLSGGGQLLTPSWRPITTLTKVEDTWDDDEDYDAVLVGDAQIARADSDGDRTAGLIWPAGERRWKVQYTAGYSTVPAGIKLLLLTLIYRAYHQRGGEAGGQAAGVGVSWASLVDGDLARQFGVYRRRAPAVVG